MAARLVLFLTTLAAWPFFRQPPQGWRRHVCALGLAAIAVIFGALQTGIFSQAGKGTFLFFDHSVHSFEQALVLNRCGKYGFIAVDGMLLGWEKPPPDIPFSDLLVTKYGSTAEYCKRNRIPLLLNENSLFFVSSVLLALPPADTATTFAVKMIVFRCALIFAALYLLAIFGVGVVPLAAISLAACNAIAVVQEADQVSVYSTMPLLLLVSSAMLMALMMTSRRRRMTVIVAASVGTGLAWAAIYNFRSSYGFAVGLQLMAALALHAIWNRPRPFGQYLGVLGGIAIAFCLFQAVLIWPLQREGLGHHGYRGYTYAYHVVWHPVVLGLAWPAPSALTKREGIRWKDAVGEELAQRIDPSVKLLGPNYDAALRRYYFSLWKNYPSEMLAIYNTKIQTVGEVVVGLATAVIRIDAVIDVSKLSLNGYARSGALVVGALLAIAAYPLNAPLAMLAFLLTVALLSLSAEQAIVLTALAPTHQAALPVCLASLGAIYCAFAGMLLLRLGRNLSAILRRRHSGT